MHGHVRVYPGLLRLMGRRVHGRERTVLALRALVGHREAGVPRRRRLLRHLVGLATRPWHSCRHLSVHRVTVRSVNVHGLLLLLLLVVVLLVHSGRGARRHWRTRQGRLRKTLLLLRLCGPVEWNHHLGRLPTDTLPMYGLLPENLGDKDC